MDLSKALHRSWYRGSNLRSTHAVVVATSLNIRAMLRH